MTPPKDGSRVTLTLRHGETLRTVRGVVRSFSDDQGERRYELVTGPSTTDSRGREVAPAIGFLPENIEKVD